MSARIDAANEQAMTAIGTNGKNGKKGKFLMRVRFMISS